jgi:hypothetical protein
LNRVKLICFHQNCAGSIFRSELVLQIEQGPAVYEAVAVIVVVVGVPEDAEDRLVASSVGVIDNLAGS